VLSDKASGQCPYLRLHQPHMHSASQQQDKQSSVLNEKAKAMSDCGAHLHHAAQLHAMSDCASNE